MKQLTVTKSAVRRAEEIAAAIEARKEEIDRLIRQKTKDYRFERIPRIERTILRLGVYEILYAENTPPKVAIAEAIRLARKFAAPQAATFVNAILDVFLHEKSTPSL